MVKITEVKGREIYDSRGNPTVEADVLLSDGSFGRAAVPSGASTGVHEALELRDGDPGRLSGMGVTKAVSNINTEINSLLSDRAPEQSEIDMAMNSLDGTPNKSRLGANAILAVSLAISKAAALSRRQPLWDYFRGLSRTIPEKYIMPVPMMNILNGGRHASGASDLQEYMIIPVGASTFSHAMEMGVAVFQSLKKILAAEGFATTVGDEGGFAPPLGSNAKPLDIIKSAVVSAGLEFGQDIAIGLDAAASEFCVSGNYVLKSENRTLNTAEIIAMYQAWSNTYPLISLEDGLEQDDWTGYQQLTSALGNQLQLVGDDLFVTDVKRLRQGIDSHVANAILIKLNQIGTVTETVAAIDLARANGYKAIVSHRSGETEDTTIADFVVGLSTGQIKTGSLSRSERLAKYNQLLRIEEILGDKAVYPGPSAFSGYNR